MQGISGNEQCGLARKYLQRLAALCGQPDSSKGNTLSEPKAWGDQNLGGVVSFHVAALVTGKGGKSEAIGLGIVMEMQRGRGGRGDAPLGYVAKIYSFRTSRTHS